MFFRIFLNLPSRHCYAWMVIFCLIVSLKAVKVRQILNMNSTPQTVILHSKRREESVTLHHNNTASIDPLIKTIRRVFAQLFKW
jgi:hypothetical protein